MIVFSSFALSLIANVVVAVPQVPADTKLKACGDAYYSSDDYTCYDGNFLCPLINGQRTLRCGPDCYLPSTYSCNGDQLVGPLSLGSATSNNTTTPSNTSSDSFGSNGNFCSEPFTSLHLSDPPYENYFHSDCHSASQVIVTSPLPDSNLSIIGPRLLVAWPAGNSGLVAFFAPQNGVNGSLNIGLENGTNGQPLSGIYEQPAEQSLSGHPRVGISTLINFNSSAILTVPIIGSIRNIRDFTEGPSILMPLFQDALEFTETDNKVAISRVWLDNKTTTYMSFSSQGDGSALTLENRTLSFEAGIYNFTAWFDYPQLTQLSSQEVLNDHSMEIISQQPAQAQSLSFLSYSDKLLAGAWRFLTYFGRDSMISLLLMQPILSQGEGSATEAVISAVLERINVTDGSVCHEETIGDYATFLNFQKNITSTDPGCTYFMVDTDYFFAPVMESYFLGSQTGRERMFPFLAQYAKTDFGDGTMTYAELATLNAERVMKTSAPFAMEGGQIMENLIHLKEGEIVGEWRDSTYGIGGGRIPYDVATSLVPAALNSIAKLSAAGLFPEHPEWNQTAARYAKVWEDSTLQFFEVTVPQAEAKQLVEDYTTAAGFGFESHSNAITGDIHYHGLALNGNNGQELVKVMNTDDCFRHFLVNSTNQTQLTAFLNQSANNILAPYPVGLSNPVGLLVANPAYGGHPVYAANFSNNAYHGTVVWSWQMAMMAAGLQRQLGRCDSSISSPEFCDDEPVYRNVVAAYNHLWDIIDANRDVLSNEVWSWIYKDGDFQFEPLGALPPPAGVNPTESNVRQLWSLTFLAVQRDESLM
jgi:hypothetical protein